MFDVFFLQLMATVYQQQKRERGQQILFCLLIHWLSKYEIEKNKHFKVKMVLTAKLLKRIICLLITSQTAFAISFV